MVDLSPFVSIFARLSLFAIGARACVQVFVGEDKIIGLDAREKLHFRLGMDAATPIGTKWQQMNNPGRLKQIAIGKGRIVGVNSVFAVWVGAVERVSFDSKIQ